MRLKATIFIDFHITLYTFTQTHQVGAQNHHKKPSPENGKPVQHHRSPRNFFSIPAARRLPLHKQPLEPGTVTARIRPLPGPVPEVHIGKQQQRVVVGAANPNQARRLQVAVVANGQQRFVDRIVRAEWNVRVVQEPCLEARVERFEQVGACDELRRVDGLVAVQGELNALPGQCCPFSRLDRQHWSGNVKHGEFADLGVVRNYR